MKWRTTRAKPAGAATGASLEFIPLVLRERGDMSIANMVSRIEFEIFV